MKYPLNWRVFTTHLEEENDKMVALRGRPQIYKGLYGILQILKQPRSQDLFPCLEAGAGKPASRNPNSRHLVQSKNSPIFPPPKGAEPVGVKRESRITCMHMLRTNQSKITISQPLVQTTRVPIKSCVRGKLYFFKRFFLCLVWCPVSLY